MYDLLLFLYAIYALPKMIYQKLFHGKYKNSFAARFGSGFPTIEKNNRPLVWIHAVSLGETKAVAALAKTIKREYNNPIIIISSTTETGHAEAKRVISFADYHVFLPFDFRWIIAPIVKRTSPDLVIMCETDFWLNFLKASKSVGAKVALVNGKLSERSMKRFLMWPSFANQLFGLIDCYCVQNQLYADRFKSIGVPENKITVTGNIKFDDDYPKLTREELENWKTQLGITPKDKVIVVGSTHDPEEVLVLNAMKKVWDTIPNVKVLIVPRHPERFSSVADLITNQKVPSIRYSNIHNKSGQEKVILIDAMGLLRKCYQLADIAIVGGSFTSKVGGHNIVEPCWFGVPVLFGPYMHTQAELVDLVKEYNAGKQVTADELPEVLESLLQEPERRSQLGQGGERLVAAMRGATERTWKALEG